MEARTTPKKNIWGKVFLISILIVLMIAVGGVATYIYQILNIDTYYDGVEVDGIPLGGMTREEALEAVRTHNQPNLDKMKIILTHGDSKWEYDYKDINAQINIEEIIDEAYVVGRQGTLVERLKEIYRISNEPKRYETTLTYDVTELKDEIEAIAQQINEEPIDATIEFHPDKKEKFSFTPDKVGKGMLTDKAMEELIARVDAGDFSPYEIPIEQLDPQYTLDELKTWTSRIAYYSTPLNNNANRNHNIFISSKGIYNLRLDPGEVFSVNESTGPIVASAGYRLAPVIKDGSRFEDGLGGGVCQTSSTLFGAVLRADLEIVERYNHSIPSTYTPIGTDATISYPYADFKFMNNRDTPIFITRYISGGRLHIEIYGKKSDEYDEIKIVSWETSRTEEPEYKVEKDPNLFEGEEEIEYKSRPGIKAVAYKVYYKDGKEIRREKAATSSYRKVVGLKRVGTKKRPDEAPENPADGKPKDEKPKDEKPNDEKPKDEKPDQGDNQDPGQDSP